MSSHDMPLDVERLLANTGWLQALALRLAGEPSVADDLVQDTWVRALESPPRSVPDEGSLRAWLATVTRNLWRTRARTGARRSAREEAAARDEALPSVAATVERVALQRALVEAVLALDSPDREIVVLRFFEEQPPRAIAERLGMSSSAVRTRLSRALDRLGARLDGAYGGERSAWIGLLLPWTSSRAPLSAAGLGSALAVGAVWKLALSIVAAALVAVVGWRVVDGGAPPSSTSLASPAAGKVARVDERDASPAGESDARGGPPISGEPARRAVLAPPAAADRAGSAPELVLVGRCVDRSGAPLQGVQVAVSIHGGEAAAESDARGSVRVSAPWDRIDWIGEGQARVRAAGPAVVSWTDDVRVEAPGEHHLGDIVLDPGGVVVGRVVDATGAPRAGAWVVAVDSVEEASAEARELRRAFLLGMVTTSPRDAVRTQTGIDGSFRLEGVPARTLALAAAVPGHFLGHSAPFSLAPGAELRTDDIVVELAGPAHVVAGVVLDEADAPVSSARMRLLSEKGDEVVLGALAGAGPDGRFSIVVPRERSFSLEVTHPHRPRDTVRLSPVRAGDVGLEVRFTAESWIEVEVLDSEGEAVPEWAVMLGDENGRFLGSGGEPLEDGALRLRVPAEPFQLVAVATGYERAALGPFEPATAPERVVIRVVRAARLRGRVVDPSGEPVPGATVDAYRTLPAGAGLRYDDGFVVLQQPTLLTRAESGDDGRFELPFPLEGEVVLQAAAPGRARSTSRPLHVARGVDQDGLELVLPEGGAIEGRVRTAEGVDPAGTIVGASCGDGAVLRQTVGPDGAYRFEHLAPGPWQVLRVSKDTLRRLENRTGRSRPGDQPVDWSCTVAEGVTTTFDLDLRDEVRGVLRGRLTLDGRGPAGWKVSLYQGADRARPSAVLDASGTFGLPTSGRGTARLSFHAPPGVLTGTQLLAEPEVDGHETAWQLDLQTASLTLANLPALPGGAGAEDSQQEWLQVDAEPSPGAHWVTAILQRSGGELRIETLPAGCTLRLRRCTPTSGERSDENVLAELELGPGEDRRVVLP